MHPASGTFNNPSSGGARHPKIVDIHGSQKTVVSVVKPLKEKLLSPPPPPPPPPMSGVKLTMVERRSTGLLSASRQQ